ncbi:MAG: FG-GAP repeat protein [Planctomycetales bacterium]|nr:FG-GAP repeat protein [Planctomycetales bacterium]
MLLAEDFVNSAKNMKLASGTNGVPTLLNYGGFGWSMASLGDLDGDGVTDLAVGAINDDTGGSLRGAVYVQFMNANGSVKSSVKLASGTNGVPTLANSSQFGSSVASMGDIDGDGVTDLAVGAYGDGSTKGAVHVVFLNSNGTVKISGKLSSGTNGVPTLAAFDFFGNSVASLGDLDGDGVRDLAVGAYGDGTLAGTPRGAVHVLLLNANGSVKTSVKLTSGTNGVPTLANGDKFGFSLASLGDLDGDGVTDLAVGALGDDTGGSNRGAVYVQFMNANGTVKSSLKLASGANGVPTLADGDFFGSSVTSLGDLDNNGVIDLAVGAKGDDTAGVQRGAVYVLMLEANGTVKSSEKLASGTNGGPTLVNGDSFGSSVALLGDLDGDGVRDLAVGANQDDTGGTGRGAVHMLFLTGQKLTELTQSCDGKVLISVNSTPNTTFQIDIAQEDPTGSGAGRTFLGVTSLTTNAKGLASIVSPHSAASGFTLSARAIYPNGFSSRFSLAETRPPVMVLPGIGGTFATSNDSTKWYLNRGVPPESLSTDPIAFTYKDLIQTLKNAGYQDGKDLFIVNYDWRVLPGPIDGVTDGHISGLTAASISSGPTLRLHETTDIPLYRYGVDYLGTSLRTAAESWTSNCPGVPPPISADVIAHSTGGLVTRTYIQSDAYNGIYEGTKKLLPINRFIMYDVPNQGASKPWNPIHDDWGFDTSYELLSKFAKAGFLKLIQGQTIHGPDYDIRLGLGPDTATTKFVQGTMDAKGNPIADRFNREKFTNLFIPTLRTLLATYNFLDRGDGVLTNVNSDVDEKNWLGLDLNGGADRNAFAGQVGQVIDIYGDGVETATTVTQETCGFFVSLCKIRFTILDGAFASGRATGDITYFDQTKPAGDGTVPLESLEGQFLGDPRVILSRWVSTGFIGFRTDVSHVGIVANPDVLRAILEFMGDYRGDTVISSGSQRGATGLRTLWNLTSDPVEAILTDANGKRLGYSLATGVLTEIPNSVYLGEADGMGFVFGPVATPVQLDLAGLGEGYVVQVSGAQDGGFAEFSSTGTLGLGEVRNFDVPFVPNAAPTLDNTGAPYVIATAGSRLSTDMLNGIRITDLLARGAGGNPITDSDAGAVEGIALTAINKIDGSFGRWEYTLVANPQPADWINVESAGAVSNTSALLLPADANARLRFVTTLIPRHNNMATDGSPRTPAEGFIPLETKLDTGITFRAWDRATGTADGRADTTSNGGTTAFSTATETAGTYFETRLFRSFNTTAQLNTYTLEQEFNALVNSFGYQDRSTADFSGFTILMSPIPGVPTAALYRMYFGIAFDSPSAGIQTDMGYRYLTTNLAEVNILESIGPAPHRAERDGFYYRELGVNSGTGVTGYVYTTAQPGTTEMFQIYRTDLFSKDTRTGPPGSPATGTVMQEQGDHAYTTKPTFEMTKSPGQQHIEGAQRGWRLESSRGFVRELSPNAGGAGAPARSAAVQADSFTTDSSPDFVPLVDRLFVTRSNKSP